MPYSDPLDPTTPLAAEAASQGDDRIRALKLAINERMADLTNGWPAGPLSLKIPNLYILTAMLNDLAVSTPKLADNAVTNVKMADASVGTAELIDGSITTPKYANASIPTGAIALLAITDALIASVHGGKIVDGSIDGAVKLLDGSIPGGKLAPLGSAALIDGAVTEPKIADLSVTLAKLKASLKDLIAVTKYADINVAGGGPQGSDTASLAGGVALVGAAINDPVILGFPNVGGWAAADKTLTWIGYVDVVDHIALLVQNNTGGGKTWPAVTIRAAITKSMTAWGM